tara:strand:- start:119 stop:649 length:531 start_codon:yes stop_codon:yes gene_type:complete
MIRKKRIPDMDFILSGEVIDDGVIKDTYYSTSAWFADKKVILFAVPGAYTPTCTEDMLPNWEEYYDKFEKDLGIDSIYCTGVNDGWVMNAWKESLGIEKIEMLPDGNGELAESLGMLVRKTNRGFGNRSWRYAAYVVGGIIEELFEEPGRMNNCPNDPYSVSNPAHVYKELSKKLL